MIMLYKNFFKLSRVHTVLLQYTVQKPAKVTQILKIPNAQIESSWN